MHTSNSRWSTKHTAGTDRCHTETIHLNHHCPNAALLIDLCLFTALHILNPSIRRSASLRVSPSYLMAAVTQPPSVPLICVCPLYLRPFTTNSFHFTTGPSIFFVVVLFPCYFFLLHFPPLLRELEPVQRRCMWGGIRWRKKRGRAEQKVSQRQKSRTANKKRRIDSEAVNEISGGMNSTRTDSLRPIEQRRNRLGDQISAVSINSSQTFTNDVQEAKKVFKWFIKVKITFDSSCLFPISRNQNMKDILMSNTFL